MPTFLQSLFGPRTIHIDISFPALSDLVGFLRELDTREQLDLQRKIDQMTQDLKLTNDTILNALKEN